MVEEIGEYNSSYDSRIAAYCLRDFLGIPIILFQPKVEQKATRNKAAVWSVKPWYARDTDKTNFRTRTSFIHLVTNGGPCCVPALPSCLAELKKLKKLF